MANNIRWGIIGCGDVTEVKSGPAFQKAEGSELVAVMRRNGALARGYAKRHGVGKYYDNAKKLIDDPEVDAVYVATPPSSHMVYTRDALKKGKPVYVEKPMAMNFEQCQRMVRASEEAKTPLFVAYYRRGLPRFLKINMMLHRGEIGTVKGVSIRFYKRPSDNDKMRKPQWRVDPNVAGCGYFCDLGSHIIDLIQYFLGDIIKVHGFASNLAGLYEAEDNVNAIFQFPNSVLGTGHWRFDANENLDEVEIYGSKGKISYQTFGEGPVVLEKEGKKEVFSIPHPPHIQQPLIQTIVDQLNGKGRCSSTGKTGARTNWVMDKTLGRL